MDGCCPGLGSSLKAKCLGRSAGLVVNAMAKVTPGAHIDVEDGAGLPAAVSPPLPTTKAVMKASMLLAPHVPDSRACNRAASDVRQCPSLVQVVCKKNLYLALKRGRFIAGPFQMRLGDWMVLHFLYRCIDGHDHSRSET